jgi:AcrR family transcriptional regulator
MARRAWHKSTETRTEILDEVERQLTSVGYAAMTVDSIAKALGMSSANVFKNFGSKSGLIDAVALRWLMEIDALVESAVTIGSPSERLRAIANLILREHIRRGLMPSHIAIMVGLNFVPPPSAISFLGRLLEHFRAIVASGVESGEFAPCDAVKTASVLCDCLISVLDPAVIVRARSLYSEEEITRKCDDLVDFVISGLRFGVEK